jgi:competence ComEA-like helix-hairpin-helix protein
MSYLTLDRELLFRWAGRVDLPIGYGSCLSVFVKCPAYCGAFFLWCNFPGLSFIPDWRKAHRTGMMKHMNRSALLTSFLVVFAIMVEAQDLPAGKGKELVENTCGSCHGLDVVVAQHATKDGWQSIVDYMVSRGATGTPEEIKTIVEYLAANFPAKTNVNKATSADLQTQLELSAKDADAIVKYRTDHGDFKDWDSLTKVPGIDAKKLEAKKDSIAFTD